ncbi:sensor histidine kinase [Microvirga roseola]|uniref:sensor histidine kinase n=1 Tax=Microvirga roseola TaxID=2883126 RepID=UPI001E59AC95|nr:histidine kinase dimerization/phosphoacceptor domain -containing protein [Microvirga roseola]
MMQNLFTYTFQTRNWPVWARYLGATLVVALALMARLALDDYLPAYPFLLFFASIIINASLFNRGTGFYSVVLSAVLATVFFIEPVGRFEVEDPRQITGMIFFLVIGLTTAGIIEALHTTAHSLTLANKRLAAAEQERDLLLREAGHRMKNDLATLTALVRLQERAVQDQTARSVLASTADRIHVLSRVHERLRLGEGVNAVINVSDFITELCDDLKAAVIGLRPIVMRIETERCWLTQERSVAIGLIINELVTNSLKYAFPEERSGTISVRFSREGDRFRLVVVDDGVGMSPQEPNKPSGLGQRLVRSMTAQLGGTFDIQPDSGRPGTLATVEFPVVE